MDNWKYLMDACSDLRFHPNSPDRIAGILEALSYVVEERPDGGATSLLLFQQARELRGGGTIIPPVAPEEEEEEYDDETDDFPEGEDEEKAETGSFEGLVQNLRWFVQQIQSPSQQS